MKKKLVSLGHPGIIKVNLDSNYQVGYLIGDVTTNVVGSTFYPNPHELIVRFGIDSNSNSAMLFVERGSDKSLSVCQIGKEGEGHLGLQRLVNRLARFYRHIENGFPKEAVQTLLPVGHHGHDIKSYGITFDKCQGAFLVIPTCKERSDLDILKLLELAEEGVARKILGEAALSLGAWGAGCKLPALPKV